MREYCLGEKCIVNTNYDGQTFVGIRAERGEVSVHFPLGFSLAKTDENLRKDILLLISVLSANTNQNESSIAKDNNVDCTGFPITSYIYVMKDYFDRGLFREKTIYYRESDKGKISWKRTISTQRPVYDDGNIFYLDYVTKHNSIKDNEMITLVHEYLVYDSFIKMGWLFTDYIPAKPRLQWNNTLFSAVIEAKLSHTFNDHDKQLFLSMLHIIHYLCNDNDDNDYLYGTYNFEYVWERMIDRVFGIKNKSDYFPKTSWHICDKKYDNAVLEPDTIMLIGDDVYVLDAKYYKYGQTHNPSHLPESASINKQITYGEYIFEKIINQEISQVYNAFIMPFESKDGEAPIVAIGEARSSWKSNKEAYQRVIGVLVDTKYLMKINVQKSKNDIATLAEIIQDIIEKNG